MSDKAVHIKIDYSEANSANEEILSCENEFFNIVKQMKGFNLLRKQEFILKNKLKNEIAGVERIILKIETELPETGETGISEERKTEKAQTGERDILRIEKARGKTIKRNKRREIEEGLEEIKAKLERFS